MLNQPRDFKRKSTGGRREGLAIAEAQSQGLGLASVIAHWVIEQQGTQSHGGETKGSMEGDQTSSRGQALEKLPL